MHKQDVMIAVFGLMYDCLGAKPLTDTRSTAQPIQC